MAELKIVVAHHHQSARFPQPNAHWITICMRALGFTALPVILSEVVWFIGSPIGGYLFPVLLPFLGYPIDLWWGKDQLFIRTTYYSWALWLVTGCSVAWLTQRDRLGKASLVFALTLMILSAGIHLLLRSLGYTTWLTSPLF